MLEANRPIILLLFFCRFSPLFHTVSQNVQVTENLKLSFNRNSASNGDTFFFFFFPGLLFSSTNTSVPLLPYFVRLFASFIVISVLGHMFLPPEGRWFRVANLSFVPQNIIYSHPTCTLIFFSS